MKSQGRALLGILIPVGLIATLMSGCSKDSSTDTPAQSQATTQQNVSAVQNNPNIPPEAKAALSNTVQGKDYPKMQPQPAPAPKQ